MLLGGAVLETREILTRFKNGELSMEETEHYFRKEPFEQNWMPTEKYDPAFRK